MPVQCCPSFSLFKTEEIDSNSVFYISVIADVSKITELRESLDAEARGSCHIVLVEDIYTPGYHWLEFTSAVGTKARAADQSYAVANSIAEVKLLATAVIGSNSDEGVAIWLESQFF
jgi:hypothetical protein